MSQPTPESLLPSTFKYQLPVTISVAGGSPIAGWVSLSRRSEFRSGPQTLLERLNERVRVLPVVHSDVTHLVNRSVIEWAEPAPGVEPALTWQAVFAVTREEQAAIRMRSGRVIHGVIALEMPEDYNRTSDFLNGSEDFFALRCGERTLLVNKQRVRDVRLEARSGAGTG